MKTIRILIISLLILPLIGCSKKEKDRLMMGSAVVPTTNGTTVNATSLGTITLGADGSLFASPIATIAFPSPTSEIQSGEISINSLEITSDGSNWIQLISTPTHLIARSTRGPFVYLNSNPISVPSAEYHGVKIELGAGLENLETLSGNVYPYTLNEYPRISLRNTGFSQDQGISNEALLTTANGHFTSFELEAGENTFLVLGLYLVDPDESEWRLTISVRATNIQPS